MAAAAAAAATPAFLAARASISLLLASRLCDTPDEGVARQCCELLTVLLDPTTMEPSETNSYLDAAYAPAPPVAGGAAAGAGSSGVVAVDSGAAVAKVRYIYK